MSQLNEYLQCGPPSLTALPGTGICDALTAPLRSQICAVLVLPVGVDAPSDWTDKDGIEGTIDNSVVGNSVGKWLVGYGEVPDPEEITTTLGRVKKIACSRKYTLLLNKLLSCEENFTFLQLLSKNWTGFRFWFYTIGGRFVGGSTGITPSFVSPKARYGGSTNDVESATLRIEWDADSDTNRAYVPGIFGNTIPSQDAQFEVSVYRQQYSNQSSSELIWTTNSGELTAPFANNVWVFQNGSKLNPDKGQYSVTPDSSPGQSTITIDGSTHYAGSNYEIFHLVPA